MSGFRAKQLKTGGFAPRNAPQNMKKSKKKKKEKIQTSDEGIYNRGKTFKVCIT